MRKDRDGGSRIVVVGAGIVGACCAAYLRREGHAVTLLEAEEPAAGASRGNAGALSPGSCIPLSMPGVVRDVPRWLADPDGPLVVRASYLLQALPWLARFVAAGRPGRIEAIADALHALHGAVYDSYQPILQASGAGNLIRQTGCIVLYCKPGSLESAMAGWQMRKDRGIPFEVLDQKGVHDLVPALAPGFACGVYQPQHGYVVDPQALVVKLVDHFKAGGGDLVIGRAARIDRQGERIAVALEDGRSLDAERIVVAAGAWSKPLLAGLGLSIPLETQRGYHLQLPDPGIELPLPVSFSESKFYATPMAGGLRLAGTVEFARASAPPDFRRARQLGALAGTWLPGLNLAGAQEWMGRRPCTPDSLPLIGAVPKDPRILLAFGHGHNGMTSAPTTGRVIADLIAGRSPFIDLTPFRPDRF
ncbi:MAG: FAD-dependent oxidoreductase [Hyphomicrobiaceae bacterium]|nr:FAD-dependent oxidoreductase [Hyphomicrobiaceae bacterium]